MLNKTFAALADPTRRTIVEFLSRGELSVGELVEEFPLTQSAISRHLQVLEHAGLVARRRDGQRRFCSLNDAPLEEADRWIARHRKQWEDRLDRLDLLLRDGGESEDEPL